MDGAVFLIINASQS